ncbi:hypothetical protein D3C80_1874540 [compost metagenome]
MQTACYIQWQPQLICCLPKCVNSRPVKGLSRPASRSVNQNSVDSSLIRKQQLTCVQLLGSSLVTFYGENLPNRHTQLLTSLAAILRCLLTMELRDIKRCHSQHSR